MTVRLGVFAALLGVAIAPGANAQHLADPRVADLIGAGRIRFGSFPPQHIKDPATGELNGPTVHVMRALGARMGLSVVLVELPTLDKLIECLDAGACDVGCLGYDPARADQVGGFTPPFMQVEFTLLVPGGSLINTVADADRPGIRIAGVRHHASTAALARAMKNAELVLAETPDEAFELLRNGQVHGWASARAPLVEYSADLADSRVLAENYGGNSSTLVVPKGRSERLAYLSQFVEEARASGALQRAIKKAGQPGYRVADPIRR